MSNTKSKGDALLRTLGCIPVVEWKGAKRLPAGLADGLLSKITQYRDMPQGGVLWIIPPESARVLVSTHMSGNRSPSSCVPEEVTSALLTGYWHPGGDWLRFNSGGLLNDGQNRCLGIAASGRSAVVPVWFDFEDADLVIQMDKNDDQLYQYIARNMSPTDRKQYSDGVVRNMVATMCLLTNPTNPRRVKSAIPAYRCLELFNLLMPELGEVVSKFPSRGQYTRNVVWTTFYMASFHMSADDLDHCQAILLNGVTPQKGFKAIRKVREYMDHKVEQIQALTSATPKISTELNLQMYRQLFVTLQYALLAVHDGTGESHRLGAVAGTPDEVRESGPVFNLPKRKRAPEIWISTPAFRAELKSA